MMGTGVGILKGSIMPELSDKMLCEFHRQWKLQPGTERAKLKKMNGGAFEIEYEKNWANAQGIFELIVGKAANLVDPKSTPRKVAYNSAGTH